MFKCILKDNDTYFSTKIAYKNKIKYVCQISFVYLFILLKHSAIWFQFKHVNSNSFMFGVHLYMYLRSITHFYQNHDATTRKICLQLYKVFATRIFFQNRQILPFSIFKCKTNIL